MAFNNYPPQNGAMTQVPPNRATPNGSNGWQSLTPNTPRPNVSHGPQPPTTPPKRKQQRRILVIGSIVMLVVLIFAALRFSMVGTADNDVLQIAIGDQQAGMLDLKQSSPVSPYLMGTNVFPIRDTASLDTPFSGFMNFTPLMKSDLLNARFQLLRYPGGEWGEQHILSYDQLNDFSKLLNSTRSEGMLQVHITGPVNGTPQNFANLQQRANLAGNWVDYMNNPKSNIRTGARAKDAFHQVKFWVVGNEPDQKTAIDPDTQKPFTVKDYVQTFIAYSLAMHQNNPSIQVFGPEISQFYGVGAGPRDANGQLWMEQFLQGIGSYEQAHAAELAAKNIHLLDGVSFHRYQFIDASQSPGMLAGSSNEWNYNIPQLRQVIKRYVGRDLPIAVTEINTNPSAGATNNSAKDPSRGQAALWWADTLGTLMNQQVAYTAFFSIGDVNTPYPLFTNQGKQETAMFRVMQLFSHMQRNLVPLSIQHDPISVYATEDDTRQTVSLMFVNKSSISQEAQITSMNQFLNVSSWRNQTISIAGNSIIVLTMHRGGAPATAYNYMVPAQDDTTIKPLSYTECGNGDKKDLLAAYIPC